MTEELKPCPFCGATDSEDNATQQAGVYLVSFRSPVGGAHRVECQCGASGAAAIDGIDAKGLWNRRADQCSMTNPTTKTEPGEIKIEHTNDGSIVITQANLFRLYDDEVTITAGQFAVVFKALQEILNEIREIESL